jgi:hypothetical protein
MNSRTLSDMVVVVVVVVVVRKRAETQKRSSVLAV